MMTKEAQLKEQHAHSHSENRFAVIPTPVRLNASVEHTGKGVTIAFIDSGFYAHPDLVESSNRIKVFHDVTGEGAVLKTHGPPENFDWHGTQTCVSAAGNGHLSNGVYRGLAPDADLVLLKAGAGGHIIEENIARGLEWLIENKDRYNIRVISISLGGEADVPSDTNAVDRLAETAVRNGIVVVVAAGNSGCSDRHHTVPPANAPSVITVGGYDDKNELDRKSIDLYCSSFGPTADGNLKPEIVAPAMWIAAPILPETSLYRKAEVLSQLALSPDYQLEKLLHDNWNELEFGEAIRENRPDEIRKAVEKILQRDKIIATHYQHVDGTSFAAPIVASVAAQMLEANPRLTPSAIKQILIATASRISNAPIIRQGYGVLNARAAVQEALRESHTLEPTQFHPPRVVMDKLIFFYHNDSVTSVSLAGEFNNWDHSKSQMARDENGIWKIELKALSSGRYRYKFVIDQKSWIDDPSNGMKEPDSNGGFNSILNIASGLE